MSSFCLFDFGHRFLLRERTTGTLYRLLATPVRRGEIISGYLLGYGIFAIIQTLANRWLFDRIQNSNSWQHPRHLFDPIYY